MPSTDDDAGATPAGVDASRVIAFFDVDNTLVHGASAYYLARVAWKRGYIGWRDITRFAWQQARFKSVGENHRHQLSARDRALELVVGHTVRELEELAVETFDLHLQTLLLPQVVRRAREHIEQGHQVWLITATPEACAQVIAARLGLTGALGPRIHSVDGVFTGELMGPVMHGGHKADAAARLAGESGVRLADCWAYSDSRNDIPLLELVGNRQVVNPDVALTRHAIDRDWPILRDKP